MIVFKDVASGLNDKRKGLWKMIHNAQKGKFKTLFCTYPDRLSRFCVRYLENFLKVFNVKVVYIKDKSLEIQQNTNFTKELVDDLMAIITCFSGKLYESRAKENFKKDRQKAVNLEDDFFDFCINNCKVILVILLIYKRF